MARAKICGIKQTDDLEACIQGGAEFVGFVDFPKSPRHLEPDEAGRLLGQAAGKVQRVLLTVDAQDQRIEQWLNAGGIDLIQCQGQETPERIASLKNRFGVPLMKALGVGSSQEVESFVDTYAGVADWLLFEPHPPAYSDRPGGNATLLNWSILQDADLPECWMLAGGLTPNNVADAIATTHAPYVDVSSGVERTKGVKDAGKIAEFLAAVDMLN